MPKDDAILRAGLYHWARKRLREAFLLMSAMGGKRTLTQKGQFELHQYLDKVGNLLTRVRQALLYALPHANARPPCQRIWDCWP